MLPTFGSLARRGLLGLLLLGALACSSSETEAITMEDSIATSGGPSLRVRPASFERGQGVEVVLGRSDLGLGEPRDGFLFVPSTYEDTQPLPLIVALHGATGSESAWSGYAGLAEDRQLLLLVPESRGRTWDAIGGGFGPDIDFIEQALALVFRGYAVDLERIAVMGFSDGASYALTLGLSNGHLFSHVIAHSPGFIPGEQASTEKPAVFVSHGRSDSVLPLSLSRDRIVPDLTSRGYEVRYEEFDGGHELPSEIALGALDWFLATGDEPSGSPG